MLKEPGIIPQWLLFVVALFCFIAIADLPYGFYILLRWVVFGVAIAASLHMQVNRRINWIWILGIVALIFNPFIPFHFPKNIWRFLDAVAGVSFFVLGIIRKYQQKG